MLDELVDVLNGRRIAGGCDHCDAYQTMRRDELVGVFRLSTHHDDWCPVLAARGKR